MSEFENVEVQETDAVPFDEGGDEGYTAEDWAAIREANGITEDAVEVDDADEGSPDETDVADVSTDSGDEDPWAWVKDKDPEKVRKTWDKFTEEWAKVAELEKQYQPAMQLMEEIQNDPALQAHLRAYYEQPRGVGDEVLGLKQEVAALRREQTIKEEFEQLSEFVAKEGLPQAEMKEVVAHAAKVGAPNLMSAYKDLKFDEIREAEREKTLAEVKKLKGAAVPKVNNGTKVRTGITQGDIDNMSEEEFISRYDEIQKFYSGKQ